MQRNYRDTAFTFLFDNEKYASDLYEVVNGIRLSDGSIEIRHLKQEDFTVI